MAEKRPPFFEKAPVVERVLGVQFSPIPKFTNGHLGAFWRTLNLDEWSDVSDAPAVPQQIEAFLHPQGFPNLGMLSLGFGFPGTRLLIKNSAGNRIIQIQNGMFNYNWIGRGEAESYPRFEKISDEFFDLLARFKKFVGSVGDWNANQWEVTYLNHLPKGTVWNGPEDWDAAFASGISLPYRLPSSKLDALNAQWRYEIEPQRGRLYVDIQHASKVEGDKIEEILAMKLTARGQVIPDKLGWTLENGIDIGHKVIVDGFEKLASERANTFWGKQQL